MKTATDAVRTEVADGAQSDSDPVGTRTRTPTDHETTGTSSEDPEPVDPRTRVPR